MADTLLAHPAVARALLGLFTARFDPALDPRARADAEDDALAAAQELIDAVTGLDADRILRSFLGMIGATLRTNYHRERPFLSFKIDPSAVPDMPAPRPRFEIFVYSPRVEGVHLRYGAVARGGLRWSDRPQDFRTEILGLVKAQAVKNAVIVPVGAKGGFVVRRPEAGSDEVVACYKTFISGLLDVTDNLVVQPDGRSATVPPPDVVRHDGDDAYLVVAADKGTAKFSDTANEVAASYGFWLGDAFASGGSKGYDHKAMGITARGAWESVKRHFRELGVDTQARGVHRRRGRRHVRRRVRQRDAAVPAHPAGRGVRPPARVRRPRSGRRARVRRAAAAVRAAAIVVGRLRPRRDQRGRWGVAADGEVGADRRGDPRRAGARLASASSTPPAERRHVAHASGARTR